MTKPDGSPVAHARLHVTEGQSGRKDETATHLTVRPAPTERQIFRRVFSASHNLLNESPSPITENALCGLLQTPYGIVAGTCMARAGLLRSAPCTRCSLGVFLSEYGQYIWGTISVVPGALMVL
jgi:hypothetical protein